MGKMIRPERARRPRRRTRRTTGALAFADTPRGEALCLALLALLLTVSLAYVVLRSPPSVASAVDQPQSVIAFRDFYAVERNQATTFRWSKPTSALLVRPEAPGDYRLVLTVQNPPGTPQRALTASVDGAGIGTIQPEASPRDYALPLRVEPSRWIATVGHETIVDLRVAPYAQPGDARALGVVITRLALVPAPPSLAGFALVWGSALLLGAAIYAALRGIAGATRPALLALGGTIATYGMLALLSRDAALVLALLPTARPVLVIGIGVACLLAIPLIRLWRRAAAQEETPADAAPSRPTINQHTRIELVLVLLLLLAFGIFRQDPGWNENSRADLAVALVDQQTTRIDRLAGNTEDRARYAGHYYSDKAPGTAFLAAPAYGLLRLTGAAGSGTPPAIAAILPPLAFTAAGLPTILLTLLLLRFLRPLVGERWALFVALGHGLGTIAFPFGTMLFGHAAAAAFLFATFSLLEGSRRHDVAWRGALAGCCAGWAILVDFTTALGLGVLAIGVLLDAGPLRQRVRRLLLLGFGALPPLLLLAWYNWGSFGDPLRIGYATLANDEFAAGMGRGIFGVTLPRPDNLAAILFGPRGLLLLSPWLIAAPLGLIATWRHVATRRLAISGAAISVAFLAVNVGYVLPLGGWTPGPRFLLPALPFVAILAALVPRAWRPFVAAQICCAIALTIAATTTQPKAPDEFAQPLGMLWLPRLLAADLMATNAGQRWGWSGITQLLPLLCALPIALYGFAVARRADRRLWLPVALLIGLFIAFGPAFGPR